MNLNEAAKEIHQISKDHGFYDPPPGFLDRLALIHSEVSEALEEFRDGKEPAFEYHREKDGKPEGIPSELADVIIRVLDLCAYYGIDIERVVAEKVEFNRSRPFKHGRARL